MVYEPIEKLSKGLDFNGVLFLQLNRIMKLMSANDTNLLNSIEAFEVLLFPFIDKDSQEMINNISSKDHVDKLKLSYASGKNKDVRNLTEEDVEIISFISTKNKVKILMEIAQKQGLLPETGIEEELS